jgi:hypothetical protein
VSAQPVQGPLTPQAVSPPQKVQAGQPVQAPAKPLVDTSAPALRAPRLLDNKGAPDGVGDFDTESQDDRALALGVDTAGGFAVPYQLDGVKPKKRS